MGMSKHRCQQGMTLHRAGKPLGQTSVNGTPGFQGAHLHLEERFEVAAPTLLGHPGAAQPAGWPGGTSTALPHHVVAAAAAADGSRQRWQRFWCAPAQPQRHRRARLPMQGGGSSVAACPAKNHASGRHHEAFRKMTGSMITERSRAHV